jgi:hypothetical protein
MQRSADTQAVMFLQSGCAPADAGRYAASRCGYSIMDSSELKMTFVDIVEAICKRPQMYTMHGTFGEALALLDGFAYGAKLGFRGRSSSYFVYFGMWLQMKFASTGDSYSWDDFLSAYPDDATALKEFARLYREYEDEGGAPEALNKYREGRG